MRPYVNAGHLDVDDLGAGVGEGVERGVEAGDDVGVGAARQVGDAPDAQALDAVVQRRR